MTTKQLQSFILWLRKERISYTTLSAGGVTLDGVVDLKVETAPADKTPPEPRLSMFEKYAGDLMRKPATPNDIVPDEAIVDD